MNTKSIIINTLATIAFLGLIIAVVGVRYTHWQYLQEHPSTHQATIKANIIPITSQISGTIDAVYVKNNTYVKRGDLLFGINTAQYKLALAKAQEDLNQIKQQVKEQEKAVNTAEKLVYEKQEQLSEISKSALQTQILVKENQFPASESKEINALAKTAETELKTAEKQLDDSYLQLGKRGEAQARIKNAEDALKQAQLNLEFTYVAAPTNGLINGLNLKVGSQVPANKSLFALIENNEWWIDATFNKHQLKLVQPKQMAICTLNNYPNRNFNGTVEAINANKVKIKILNPDPNLPLSVGALTTVTINTQNKI